MREGMNRIRHGTGIRITSVIAALVMLLLVIPSALATPTDWVRLNLRPAMAKGMTADDIARCLVRSAERGPLSFTRQNVYNFCVKLDGSDKMKAAAEKVLDENWLPGHSGRYREAYRPAYRVLYKDFRKYMKEQQEETRPL